MRERQVIRPTSPRDLLLRTTDEQAIHRQAIADGMRSLRQVGMDHVRTGRLTAAVVTDQGGSNPERAA